MNEFRHEDGEQLLASFRERHRELVAALERARSAGTPVIYANDNEGVWDGDAPALVRKAVEGRGGDLVAAIAPQEGDRFVVMPRYSAFDHTPLDIILRDLDERILLAGAATEGPASCKPRSTRVNKASRSRFWPMRAPRTTNAWSELRSSTWRK